jgi:hypothetical protein
LASYNELEFSRPLLSIQNIRQLYEEIVKVEQTDNFDMCILFVFLLGLAVNNGQLLREIYVIFLLCLNLLKCPTNTRLLPHFEARELNKNPFNKQSVFLSSK